MVIRTQRLELRPATVADIDRLHRLWSEPEVCRYLWDGEVISRAVAEETVLDLIASYSDHGFGLWVAEKGEILATSGELVGFGYLKLFGEPAEIEIGYGLAPHFWHHGYATEISAALLQFGFTTLGRERLYARTDLPNLDSVRVMERAGMRFDRQTDEGMFGGLLVYVIDRAEYLQRK